MKPHYSNTNNPIDFPKSKNKMNERIKELIEKAEDPEHGFIIPEKFAELIVKECAEQSMVIGKYNTSNGVTPDLAIAIAVGLKKHFGVEE